jgi:hypothetical protein
MRLLPEGPRARAAAVAVALIVGCASAWLAEAGSPELAWAEPARAQAGSQPEAAARNEVGEQAGRALARVTVRRPADLQDLKSAGVSIYATLASPGGTALLIGVDAAEARLLVSRGHDLLTLDPSIDGARYYVVQFTPRFPRARGPEISTYGKLLYENGTYAVARMSVTDAERLAAAGAELRAVTLDPKPLPSAAPAVRLYPQSITADPVVQGMIDMVSSATLYQYTGDLSGEWPVTAGGVTDTIKTRHTDSGTYIQRATQYAGEHLAALGLDVEYMQWEDVTNPNVIGELPGSVVPDTIVIICGHIDDMPPGPVAPGADDNASGTSAVLVAADIMTRYSWRYTLRFALWTGEEQGHWGSHAYAQRSYLFEHIAAVLNLDMIAYNTGGSAPGIHLHANSDIPATLDIAQLFSDAVSAYDLDLVPLIVPDGISGSDHESFWDYGFAAILAIEDLEDFNPWYHTEFDQLQYLDMDYYVDFVKASVATCAHLAGVRAEKRTVPSSTPPGQTVLGALLAILALGSIRARH